MLTILPVASPQDQVLRLDTFDPESVTWVVSDLKSKLDLSRRLLSERSFIPGDAVMRASELWRTLLTRLRPDLQCVSREFAITLIATELDRREDLEWVHVPGVPQAAYDYLTQLMPILSHAQGAEMMAEWFGENPESRVRWERWYDLSRELWARFLEEGFVAPPWVSGVLVNEPSLHLVWDRPLIIDLGAELNQVEADLIANLSVYLDVEVLKPEPSWAGEYKKTLVAYEILENKIKAKKLAPLSRVGAASSEPVEYRKFTTMIAEVKDAVAQSRRWLDESKASANALSPKDIAIVAPDIESYWPALSSYLAEEGLPCQKDQVRRLHAFPDFARWFAAIRLRAGSAEEADVEMGLFSASGRASRLMSYERFKTLYTTIYGREDLARDQDVARRFEVEINDRDLISRDDWVAWMLKQLQDEVEFARVESLFKRLFAECPQATRLAPRRWLAYLEQLVAKTECRVSDGDPDGVSVINLSSAENSPASHMIVLGLTETSLKRNGGTAVLFTDVLSLSARFGFHLASEDQTKLEFEARWVTESRARKLILSVPETDFAGAAQAPSWLWVRGARELGVHDQIKMPQETRWDLIQKEAARLGSSVAADVRAWPKAQREFLAQAIREDMGEAELEAFAKGLVERLSPSAIETYLECPFVFAVKYLFRLSDVADLDLEVDASRRGSLMHKIFEMLTREPMKLSYTNEELDGLVEEARKESAMELADERLWGPLKARYLDLAKRFVEFEREYRGRFPELHTVGRELDIAGYLVPKTGELTPDLRDGVLKFVGRIDRVDEDKRGNLAIMDYKSSKGSLGQFGSWLKNNKIQLLLYAMAVEHGLTELSARPVLAALYYVARPLGRETGFKVDDVEQGLYDTAGRAQNKIASAAKERLFQETSELVRGAVDKILAGEFRPEPRESKTCDNCEWSGLCRAPHLNS